MQNMNCTNQNDYKVDNKKILDVNTCQNYYDFKSQNCSCNGQKSYVEESAEHNNHLINEKKKELNNYSFLEKNSHILIIDGDSLEIAMSNFEKEFFYIPQK